MTTFWTIPWGLEARGWQPFGISIDGNKCYYFCFDAHFRASKETAVRFAQEEFISLLEATDPEYGPDEDEMQQIRIAIQTLHDFAETNGIRWKKRGKRLLKMVNMQQ